MEDDVKSQDTADPFLQELASVTDARVELTLRTNDARQGKWLVEDPSLAVIAQMLRPR